MLRINLLPIRQLKKRANARNQLIALAALFVGILVVLGLVAMHQAATISAKEEAINAIKREEAKHAPVIRELNKLKQQKKELENKISVINKLKNESALTVHILDEVANLVDNDRMWLLSLNQQGGSLTITGIALDNQTIAQFMEALKTSPYVVSVNLSNSSLTQVSGRNLKSFALTCSISAPQPEEQQTEEQKAKQQ